MNRPLFQGERIRLTALNAETDAQIWAGWSRDSVYGRLLDTDPPRPWTSGRVKSEIEKAEIKNDAYLFAIRTLTEDKLIGFIQLDGIQWPHGNSFVAIGIGERDFWGKGYGTDAMREILRFAFDELNLYRVSLDVFEYNQRAVQSYKKAGFVEEGRMRKFIHRDGQRWDMIFMGIIREEWEAIRT